MFATFKYTLRKYRGAILGWGLSTALLAWVIVAFYETVAKNAQQFEQLFSAYPKELMALFGLSGMANFASPTGYLSFEFFSYLPLILGIFAVLAGSGLLVADEEHGILDLIAAHPISRSGLLISRGLALLLTVGIILTMGFATLAILSPNSALVISTSQLLIPFISLFALLIFLAALAFLFSMLLPSRQTAAMLSGIMLVASFFLNGLSKLNESLAGVEKFLPLHYFQGETWTAGLNWTWLAILLSSAAICSLVAWWLFLRRDIRVGGEGGWSLPKLLLRKQAAAKA